MFEFFRTYKYSKILIAKLLELYSFYGLRSALVLTFVLALGFNDDGAFTIYTTFVVCGDIISIVGAYFGDKLLTRRISWVIGAFASTFGYMYSFIHFSVNGVCIGLVFAGIGIGLSRGNSNVIINDYIQDEVPFHERHNHNGVFHIITITALMLGFLVNGFVLKYISYRAVFLLSSLSMFAGGIIFISIERENLTLEILAIYNHNSGYVKKIFGTIAFLIGSIAFSAGLYYITRRFGKNFFLSNIKCIIIIAMIVTIVFLIRKSKKYLARDSQAILSLILYAPFELIYLSFEKQTDMGFSLFLYRAVDKVIFGYELPVPVINGAFSVFILLISILFFKHSVYTYFKHSSTLMLGFFCATMYFAINFIGCYLATRFGIANSAGAVYLIFPILSLVFLAAADVIIMPRAHALLRTIPEDVKSSAASLMMLSHGSGFYVAGLLSAIVAINKDKLNTSALVEKSSLEIYQHGFLTLMGISIVAIITVYLLSKSKTGSLLVRK